MSNFVTMRKAGGFYSVFDEDAIIINYLCNYKITNGRCGFPVNSLDKVISILEDNSISYIVKENMDDNIKKDYKKINKYNNILEKGKKKNKIDYRIGSIINKIRKLDTSKLNNLLDIIEKYLDE